MASRTLYLARHGEAEVHGDGADEDDSVGLSPTGRRQAEALGVRMGRLGLDAIHHGPLPRARQTAAIVHAYCPDVPCIADDVVGDYLPSAAVTPDLPDRYQRFVASYSAEEQATGAVLAAEAIRRFTSVTGVGDSVELIITHNFLIGWFVRYALDGPDWRWLGLNQSNAALTIIRCRDNAPPTLVAFNDTSHLPDR